LYALGPRCSYQDALTQIAEADRLGLDSALFEEHHGDLGSPEVSALAAAAAARTRSIRVGSANRQLTLEFPVNAAEDYAIVDISSRGRLIMGISAGERQGEFAAAGASWTDREGRFREAVELLRTVWTQSNVQFIGDYYRFPLHASGDSGWRREPYDPKFIDQWRRGQTEAQYLPVLPRPVQLPHPPIWVNATSQAIIEWAARRGLSLLVSSFETDEEVFRKVAWYDAALARAGRNRNEVEVALARELFLAVDGNQARAKALPGLRTRLQAVKAENREDLAGLAVMKGLSDEDLLATCALYGTYAEVLDRLRRLKCEAGINHLVCRTYLPGRGHGDIIESIRLTASQLQTRLVA
jgi:alkanesulfonate monooxygenase SsuD/methylene tetrahydromethanopterin reductase-like flavin-dependent oxidoreductase (luciferase family)